MKTLPNLRVSVNKLADGSTDYLQITSDDQFALNIVLIAGKVEIIDHRPPEKRTKCSPSAVANPRLR